MRSVSPVIHLESSEAKNTAAVGMLGIHARAASLFERRRQFLLVGIDHEHGQQLSWFGLARVLTNAVPITGHLGEALPGAIRNDRAIIDRTSDRSFEHRCVDESRLWMRVGRRRTAGTIFDEHTFDALARHVGQSVLVDERDL